MVKNLHKAIRDHKIDLYQAYADEVRSRPPTTLRDTLQFQSQEKNGKREPISVDEVESAESIMKRFVR